MYRLRTILEIIIRKGFEANYKAKTARLLGDTKTVQYENVLVESQRSLRGAVQFTFGFMWRTLLLGIPLLYVSYTIGLLNPSRDIFQHLILWGFVFSMLALTVFAGYFAHRHHTPLTGINKHADADYEYRLSYSIFVTNDGVRGMVEKKWQDIDDVEHRGSTVIVHLKKTFLKILPSYKISVTFQTTEQAKSFNDAAQEAIALI